MTSSPCRWGILSTAQIARKNWKAIALSGNGIVGGVSSRSASRAEQFIDDCQREVPFDDRPQAFEGHQALLESDQIDAVYVPLPTGLRKPWVLAAAEAGKHVLIEKPIADNAADVREMIDACERNGVQFMDGVMFDHGKRIAEVCQQIRSGMLGRVRRIQTHFSFTGDESFHQDNIRTDATLEPHGCLGDLGWYCIRFILWANDFAEPTSVSGQMLTALERDGAKTSVPGEFRGELAFQGGITAGFYCTFLSANQQLATVSGEDGYLTLDDFVLPMYDGHTRWQVHKHDLAIDNCRWNFRRVSEHFACDEYHSGEANSQEVEMVRTFARHAIDGQPDPELAARALLTQRVLDACRRSADQDGTPVSLDD
ncbi:Gfo/Idh/MocA family oxidoreductase [Roseiconus nitratireducens]|uniref:Gfo/Idh/MocA family oxidoreductase n=1 Tax=Roseiconus nitratireducens TaxID=2605748 RepID=A0A5M6D9S1_9BACT|nr:Gfo/Idh/MocA family oxidoreductase [Roseiconus nitratireducens]KAA5544291.1 Gfo/Idh/MocA family oxidoreductase [Roseiconus nitratireducens]